MRIIYIVFTTFLFLSISCKKETSYSIEYDMAILEEVNKYREGKGLTRLEHNDFLWGLANEHSTYLANLDSDANHDNRDERYYKIKLEFGLTDIAENVSSGDGSASQVLHDWLVSITHTNNIEGPYNTSAVSAVKSRSGVYYYTQIFVYATK